MELRQLQYFLAVVDAGSFQLAAERVHVTQQAISRSIQHLEVECGGRLLERRKGERTAVKPSAFGLLLIPRAEKAIAEVAAFRVEMEHLMGTGNDLVRIGATPTATRVLLPQVMSAFRARHPSARIQVMHSTGHVIIDQLGSGLYDIAICDEPEEGLDRRFKAEPLYDDRNVFVARKEHPLIKKRRVELSDLVDLPWVLLGPFCRLWNELRDMHAAVGLKPSTRGIQTNSVDLSLQHLFTDNCIAYLPARLISAELADGRLARLDVRQPRARRWSCLLIRRVDSTLNLMTNRFAEALQVEAGKLPRV
jgi:DNA-binding transcriptional LysR family regulator